jgi:hypothetical protein
MINNEYIDIRRKADLFLPLQEEILNRNKKKFDLNKFKKYDFNDKLSRKKTFLKYDEIEDKHGNADIMIIWKFLFNFRIGLRMRYKSSCKYRDLTIRSKVANVGKTEIHKINEGLGDYILYCWGDFDKQQSPFIDEYILVDLDVFRNHQDEWLRFKDKPNIDKKTGEYDGTNFNAYWWHKIKATEKAVIDCRMLK